MSNLSSHIAVGGAAATTNIVRRASEIALIVAVAAALAGAWLALFTLVPLDVRIR